MTTAKEIKRIARHKRIREKISGSKERPRLNVHCSLKNMQVQLIDDCAQKTVFSLSTTAKEIKDKTPNRAGNINVALYLGEKCAKLAADKGIKEIVFDRSGYAYHGRVKALAEGLRKGGLIF
jgi:large subunit ribosomal protein L18